MGKAATAFALALAVQQSACERSHTQRTETTIQVSACRGDQRRPRKLASEQKRPTWIASDERNVYWATDHEIVRVDKQGGTPRLLAIGVADPGRLAADGEHAYWLDRGVGTSDGSLARVPVEGGPVEVLASQFAAGEALAVDRTYVYWGAGDKILRRSKSRGPDQVLATHVAATALEVESTEIYWSNADNGENPRIGAADFDGRQYVLLGGPAPGFALSVRATPDDICWTSRADESRGGVWCLRRGGAIPHRLAAGEAWTFALRGRLIYWIRSGPGDAAELVCTPLDGGASGVIASGSIADVTSDGEHVYWTDIVGAVYVDE